MTECFDLLTANARARGVARFVFRAAAVNLYHLREVHKLRAETVNDSVFVSWKPVCVDLKVSLGRFRKFLSEGDRIVHIAMAEQHSITPLP